MFCYLYTLAISYILYDMAQTIPLHSVQAKQAKRLNTHGLCDTKKVRLCECLARQRQITYH